MKKLKRDDVPSEVRENIVIYFLANLQNYEVTNVFRASNHPDDWYLFHVIAQSTNGDYACWTSWNETTKSLNFGHYNLISFDAAMEILNEMYWRV